MRKGFRYPSSGDFRCPICQKKLKTKQALNGHVQLSHGPEAFQELLASERLERQKTSGGAPLPDTKALKTELEALKLSEELANLKARRADRTRIPDISEQAGLGSLQPDVAREVQGRAFSAQPQPQKFDLMALLSSPNLPVLLDAIKGAMGIGQGGDSVMTILTSMGFSLKTLLTSAMAPKADSSLTVGGINLSGTPLTPEMFGAILQYKSVEERSKTENESRRAMSESLNRLVVLLTPLMAEKFGIKKETGGGSVSQKVEELEVLVCPRCGRETPVPANIGPGGVIRCGTEGCDQEWTAESIRPERPAAKKKREAKVKQPEPETLSCPSCKQSIDVTGRCIGDTIRCPVCDHEVKLVSEETPVPAAEPLTHLEKSERAWRGKRLN